MKTTLGYFTPGIQGILCKEGSGHCEDFHFILIFVGLLCTNPLRYLTYGVPWRLRCIAMPHLPQKSVSSRLPG